MVSIQHDAVYPAQALVTVVTKSNKWKVTSLSFYGLKTACEKNGEG